jgi:hypothetical protein
MATWRAGGAGRLGAHGVACTAARSWASGACQDAHAPSCGFRGRRYARRNVTLVVIKVTSTARAVRDTVRAASRPCPRGRPSGGTAHHRAPTAGPKIHVLARRGARGGSPSATGCAVAETARRRRRGSPPSRRGGSRRSARTSPPARSCAAVAGRGCQVVRLQRAGRRRAHLQVRLAAGGADEAARLVPRDAALARGGPPDELDLRARLEGDLVRGKATIRVRPQARLLRDRRQ